MARSSTGVATDTPTLGIRLAGGMYALNRFLMTLQNKRVPVTGITMDGDSEGSRITLRLDCPEETARRYTALLSSLEDVDEVWPAEESMEVALLKPAAEGWRKSAERARIGFHEDSGTVVASGAPEKMEAWLDSLGEEETDIMRLGPMARPGNGGD
ncbi:MAG: hypothetical protein M3338_06495 [Actinomycetota bacterium]|nr:hypothetical protein [Actinomycetota bacterium]